MNSVCIPNVVQPSVGEILTPTQAMALAIQEAKKGAGHVSPNPLVGCTIVDSEHRFLAVGFHHKLGGDHAEIEALNLLSSPESLNGSHVYVTLEPCAHAGRTPSCAKTFAKLKPASVTYAVSDPNPVAQHGAEILESAGVRTSLLEQSTGFPIEERLELTLQAKEVAEIFLHNMLSREPFVAIKVASTLDGCMALSSGESKWITGEPAREHTHLLRARYDAVLIGRNTFVADNPSLNVRHEQFPNFENRVVLLDPQGRTLAALSKSNLLKVRLPQNLFVAIRRGLDPKELAQAPEGVRLLEIDGPPGAPDQEAFDVKELLNALHAVGIYSVMVEGGAQTFATFFAGRSVQRLHLFEAPVLIGGKHGLGWSSQFGVDQMAHRMKLQRVRRKFFGEDLYTTGHVDFSNQFSTNFSGD